MSILSAIVLFAMVWSMIFFIILPQRLTTQGEAGEVVPGTPASAPAGYVVWRKVRLTTLIAIVLWVVLFVIITQGWITVRDFDFFDRLPPRDPLD